MHTLLVLIFADETGAEEMVTLVRTLQRGQLITVSDAAFVVRQKDRRIRVKQANALVGAGAFGGAFWGMLIERCFWRPWLAESNVAATYRQLDCDVVNEFLQDVSLSIEPGNSALLMMVAYMTAENLAALAIPTARAMSLYLSVETETRIREVFGIPDEA